LFDAVKLTFKRVELKMAHTWTIARGSGTNSATTVVVELTGADGTVSLGEAAPIARYKESVDTVEAFLKKVDPRGLSFKDVEGSMVVTDSPLKWMAIFPATWFGGMLLSHMVFGRCVLNELALRLKKTRSAKKENPACT
jgi:hypothetical protein